MELWRAWQRQHLQIRLTLERLIQAVVISRNYQFSYSFIFINFPQFTWPAWLYANWFSEYAKWSWTSPHTTKLTTSLEPKVSLLPHWRSLKWFGNTGHWYTRTTKTWTLRYTLTRLPTLPSSRATLIRVLSVEARKWSWHRSCTRKLRSIMWRPTVTRRANLVLERLYNLPQTLSLWLAITLSMKATKKSKYLIVLGFYDWYLFSGLWVDPLSI